MYSYPLVLVTRQNVAVGADSKIIPNIPRMKFVVAVVVVVGGGGGGVVV